MKTITFIAGAIELMQENGTPANITVGTFKIKSNGDLHYWAGRTGTFNNCTISFEIEFRPDHIQRLIDMGVIIDFDTVSHSSVGKGSPYHKSGRAAIKDGRYFIHGRGCMENWLTASATCPLHTLISLDKVCRDNHLHHISIHNDTCTGWKKVKLFQPPVVLHPFYKKVRQNLAKKAKKTADLLPVEILALKIK